VSELNISNGNKKGWETKWSKEEEDKLIKYYDKLPIEELINMFPNRNKKGIQQHAFKLNLKYLHYNKDYFENIDTKEKAYWLGFIYADGCVTTQDRVSILLSKNDEDHLQKFADCLESNIKIRYQTIKKKTTEFVTTKGNTEACSISIKNTKLQKDLIDKGVTKNKTYNLVFPNSDILPNEYIKDFIRGYFDGDGCYVFSWKERVRKDRGNKISLRLTKEINVVGKCEEFLKQMQLIIENECESKFKLYYNPKGDIPTLRIMDKDNMFKFLNHIYYDNCVCLDRKYEKVKEILNYCLAQ
jgi:hypothetical protein